MARTARQGSVRRGRLGNGGGFVVVAERSPIESPRRGVCGGSRFFSQIFRDFVPGRLGFPPGMDRRRDSNSQLRAW